jgi:hypothetical protein
MDRFAPIFCISIALVGCDTRTPRSEEDAATRPAPDGCVPDCSGRVCGPDPVCGTLCGTCAGSCIDGRCESTMPGAPRILSFGTSSPQLLSLEETLTITAVLTDPDGVDDLVGGSLLDPDSGATYGAFATSAQEGAYEISLDMQRIYEVARVEAIWPEATTVRFRARFFDQAGNEVTADASVDVMCEVVSDFIGGDCRFLAASYTSSGDCTMFTPNRALDATCTEICEVLEDGACANARTSSSTLPCSTMPGPGTTCMCNCGGKIIEG